MKCEIKNKRLYFIEYEPSEIRWVKSKLTWVDENRKTTKTILFNDNKLFTFWGIFNLLKETAPFSMELISDDSPNIIFKNIDIPENYLNGIDLLDFQIAAIKKGIIVKNGILDLPTSSGKTEIIIATILWLLKNNQIKNGIVIVPSQGLAQQFVDRAISRGFSKDDIGPIYSGCRNLNPKILVCVINTLNNVIKKALNSINIEVNDDYSQIYKVLSCNLDLLSKYDDPLFKRIVETDALFIDEAHHSQSQSYVSTIFIANKAKYVLGYSGSPFHEKNVLNNYNDTLLLGIIGKVIYKISYSYLRSIVLKDGTVGLISEPVVFFKNINSLIRKYNGKWNDVYNNYIVNNYVRNKEIVDYARKFTNLKFKTLILVQRLEHSKILMSKLSDLKIISIFGGSVGDIVDDFGQLETNKIDYDQFRKDFDNGIWDIVIGSQVMDEGFDLPAINAIIMAGGGKSRIKILQRIGRGLRRKKFGENRVFILDFKDMGHIYTYSQYKKRKELMEEIEANIIENEYVFNNMIYNHGMFLMENNNDR